MNDVARLPVRCLPAAHPSCRQAGYVTAAERKICSALRRPGEEARAVRRAGLATAARGDAAAAVGALAVLDELRRRRQPLAAAREAAWRRTVFTLAHLEDEAASESRP